MLSNLLTFHLRPHLNMRRDSNNLTILPRLLSTPLQTTSLTSLMKDVPQTWKMKWTTQPQLRRTQGDLKLNEFLMDAPADKNADMDHFQDAERQQAIRGKN